MTKDRQRGPNRVETKKTTIVYRCAVPGCDWRLEGLESWDALQRYGDHFNSSHAGEPYGSANLIKSEEMSRRR